LLEARTMLAQSPSLAAVAPPETDQSARLVAEVRLAHLRSQVAVVRALADQVEYLARPGYADGLRDQVIEEMARLGCRLLEAARSLASASPEDPISNARGRA
jgi:hypothetical protein